MIRLSQMSETYTTKGVEMRVILEHGANPDIDGGYWDETIDKKHTAKTVGTLSDARAAFIAWRDRNGLGGGNMTKECGTVYEGKKAIAKISFNGRVWTPFEYGHPDHKEIAVG